MELLCPAGSLESVYSAVYNGADAIYLGFGDFNARRNAKQFSDEDFQTAVSFCHLNDVTVYLTLNTLLTDRELSQVIKPLSFAVECGIDAVIVQDIGLLLLLRQMVPSLPLHASTQMSIHNLDGTKFCATQGICRVVLARELPKTSLAFLINKAPVELEVFAHGALCMGYSGQCYLSALVGGRSGNRGLCAQPCRLPYHKNDESKASYPLSLRDLSMIDHLKELSDMGIACLKIEGRMKRPEYVAIVTRIYKTCLLEGRKPTKNERAQLTAIFSRDGFTDAYYTGEQNDMFGTRTEKQQADKALLEHAKESYTSPQPAHIPVSMTVCVKANTPISLTLCDDKNNTITQVGIMPETALRRAISEEKIVEQLSKLGGTALYLRDITVDLDEGLALPLSAINALRRDAVDALCTLRSEIPSHAFHTIAPFDLLQKTTMPKPTFCYTISVLSIEQLSDTMLEMAKDSLIYLPFEEIEKHADTIADYQRKFSLLRFAITLPPVIWDAEVEDVKSILNIGKSLGIQDVLIGNWGQIALCAEAGFTLHGDFGLGVYNSLTMQEMKTLGFASATASFELNFSQIRDLHKSLPTEIIIYGRLPMMLTEQCLQAGCTNCSPSTLTDRKGLTFPVFPVFGCRSELYNANTLYLADKIDEVKKLGLWAGRIAFTTESSSQCVDILRAYNGHDIQKPKSFTKGLYYRKVE